MTQQLKLTLLGSLQIIHDNHSLTTILSNKAQALLCYLALTGQSHSRDTLAGLLWSEMPEAEARANLRVALFHLRRHIAPFLNIERRTIAFNAQSDYQLDVTQFEAACRQGKQDGAESALVALHQAIDLYQGDLLPGFYLRKAPAFEEWLLVRREQLRQEAVQALYRLAAHYTARGEYQTSIRYTNRLLELESWHEEFHRQLILLLALNDQRDAALAQYKTCRQILATELGIEPSAETQALYQRIYKGLKSQAIGENHLNSPLCDHISWTTDTDLPFVGRSQEYAWLIQQWNAARVGHNGLTLVEGEAGIGKTTLVRKVLRHLTGIGACVLQGQCHPFSQDVPYQPLVEALRSIVSHKLEIWQSLATCWTIELTRLLPELRKLCPTLDDEKIEGDEATRQRLFEAVAQLFKVLVAVSPIVLFLDNLHYADNATMDLLRYVLYRWNGAGLWCIGAYRAEETTPTSSMRQLQYDLQRTQRVALLRLQGLNEEALHRLMEVLPLSNRDHVQRLTQYLKSASGGNTFIIDRLLRHFQQDGVLQATDQGWQLDDQGLSKMEGSIPTDVREHIQNRILQLPTQTQTVLHLAAIIGYTFDLHMISQLSNQRLHQISVEMDMLVAQRLVRAEQPIAGAPLGEFNLYEQDKYPSGEIHYAWSSDIIRRIILESLSVGQRQQLQEQLVIIPKHNIHDDPDHDVDQKTFYDIDYSPL